MRGGRDTHPGGCTGSDRGRRSRRAVRLGGLPSLAFVAFVALVAAAAPTGAQSTPPAEGSAPDVDLDRLLRLPDSYDASNAQDPKRGGATEAEWRARFQEAYAGIAEAQADLDKSQAELEHTASQTGNYQVTAPGVSNPQNSPLSYGLQQKIREQRAQIDARRKNLRQLEIDADLAGVPTDWRAPPAATK